MVSSAAASAASKCAGCDATLRPISVAKSSSGATSHSGATSNTEATSRDVYIRELSADDYERLVNQPGQVCSSGRELGNSV